jgi:hypothetical protein
MPRLRPLVFKCPVRGIHIIADISIRDGDETVMAEQYFPVMCPCCEELHQFFGYESRNVRRFFARRLRASV